MKATPPPNRSHDFGGVSHLSHTRRHTPTALHWPMTALPQRSILFIMECYYNTKYYQSEIFDFILQGCQCVPAMKVHDKWLTPHKSWMTVSSCLFLIGHNFFLVYQIIKSEAPEGASVGRFSPPQIFVMNYSQGTITVSTDMMKIYFFFQVQTPLSEKCVPTAS